jgi:hypothetical protein
MTTGHRRIPVLLQILHERRRRGAAPGARTGRRPAARPCASPLALIAVLGLLAACRPPDIQRRVERVEVPTPVSLRNLTVLLVDPGPEGVDLEWTGHDLRTGDAFHVPYEEVLLRSPEAVTLVSTREAGNRELVVDGVLHRFDPQRECLRVRPGHPAEVVALPAGTPPAGPLRAAD